MRKIILKILVISTLLSLSLQAWALAVSDIELKSSLNQPLEAQILLLAVDSDELDSLLISIKDFAENSADQRSVKLKHEIKENENGHYINITSRDVIREPILNFLLELNWSKGHLIREYSLLIDLR